MIFNTSSKIKMGHHYGHSKVCHSHSLSANPSHTLACCQRPGQRNQGMLAGILVLFLSALLCQPPCVTTFPNPENQWRCKLHIRLSEEAGLRPGNSNVHQGQAEKVPEWWRLEKALKRLASTSQEPLVALQTLGLMVAVFFNHPKESRNLD